MQPFRVHSELYNFGDLSFYQNNLGRALSTNEQKEDVTNLDKLNADDSDYIDYDNLDSDDEIDQNIKKFETILTCDKCDYTSHVKNSLTRHVKTSHNNACDKCDFATSNQMHLTLHTKACHKENDTKKRKSIDESTSSSNGKNKKK